MATPHFLKSGEPLTPLAPQKSDARVTAEIRNPMGWVVGRTERLAALLETPEIQEIAQRVVSHLDNFCAVEEIDPQDLQGQVIRTRALRYITIRLGARDCWACGGSGQQGSGLLPCSTCEGTGIR